MNLYFPPAAGKIVVSLTLRLFKSVGQGLLKLDTNVIARVSEMSKDNVMLPKLLVLDSKLSLS